MNPLVYLVVIDISGLGRSYEAFTSLPHAIKHAHASVKDLIPKRQRPVKETDLPRRDPTCHLHLTWCEDENSITVLEAPLS